MIGILAIDRLVAAIQRRLGAQMNRLYMPPFKLEGMERDPGAPAIGVPVVPFFRAGYVVHCAIPLQLLSQVYSS